MSEDVVDPAASPPLPAGLGATPDQQQSGTPGRKSPIVPITRLPVPPGQSTPAQPAANPSPAPPPPTPAAGAPPAAPAGAAPAPAGPTAAAPAPAVPADPGAAGATPAAPGEDKKAAQDQTTAAGDKAAGASKDTGGSKGDGQPKPEDAAAAAKPPISANDALGLVTNAMSPAIQAALGIPATLAGLGSGLLAPFAQILSQFGAGTPAMPLSSGLPPGILDRLTSGDPSAAVTGAPGQAYQDERSTQINDSTAMDNLDRALRGTLKDSAANTTQGRDQINQIVDQVKSAIQALGPIMNTPAGQAAVVGAITSGLQAAGAVLTQAVGKDALNAAAVQKMATNYVKDLTATPASSAATPNGQTRTVLTSATTDGPTAWAIKALAANGITDPRAIRNWLPGLLTMGRRESANNPAAVNNWDCVPVDYQILTKRGWLKHNEVEVGDYTIGYNLSTGRSEWTEINRIVQYDDAPLVRLKNSRWEALSTPNHKWISQRRTTSFPSQSLDLVCQECGREFTETGTMGLSIHLMKTHGIRLQAVDSKSSAQLRATVDLNSRDHIVLSAPAETGNGLPISDLEAEILGWVAGDGHIELRKHRPTISIAQSKPAMVQRLQTLLESVPHSAYVDERPTRLGRKPCGPRHQFRLNFEWATDLIRRVGNPKADATKIVLAMSRPQREAWLQGMIDAEGTVDRTGKVIIYQGPGEILEAIVLAGYLTGNRPRVGWANRTESKWSQEASVRLNIPRIYVSEMAPREDAGTGSVWCVSTELGSWTCRNKDDVFLTGNSNARNGTPSKGWMQTIEPTFNNHWRPGTSRNIFDPVANAAAAIHYVMSRYGVSADGSNLMARVQQANPYAPPKGY